MAKSLTHILHYNKERAKKYGLSSTVTKRMLSEVLDQPYCTYCKEYIYYKNRSADHITPLVRLGENIKSNLTMACRDCNNSKAFLTKKEFLLIRQLPEKKAVRIKTKIARILALRVIILKRI